MWKDETRYTSLSSLRVLLDVTLEVDLGTFWKEALTALLTTTTKRVTACFSAHAGAESVLTFAGALGRLKSTFHGERR